MRQICNSITPHWLGITEKGISTKFYHRIRQFYAFCMTEIDKDQTFEKEKSYMDYLAYYSNPEIFSENKKREKERIENPNFYAQIREAQERLDEENQDDISF